MNCCIALGVIKLCSSLSCLYHYHWDYFGRRDVSTGSHVSSGSMENIPTVEMWTLIPTPKTTSSSSTELFCRSMYVCPVVGGRSHWLLWTQLSHWVFSCFLLVICPYNLTHFCLSYSICPQFSQLLILHNFCLMFHILWIIRIPL